MNKVTLQFPDLHSLWTFAQKAKINALEINARNKTLTCHCTEENIKEAVENYKAKVVATS